MGLDIHHYRTEDPNQADVDSAREFNLEDPALAKFARFASKKTNQYIDWPATFAKVSQPFEHYSQGSWSSTPAGAEYGFYRRSAAPADLPEKITFRYGGTEDDQGDLVVVDREDTVIFCEEVGYQRKSVDGAFYGEFNGWEIITDRQRVERICTLTYPDCQADFRQAFLDNWDDERSFVVVWY
jgi:hypothetical protein